MNVTDGRKTKKTTKKKKKKVTRTRAPAGSEEHADTTDATAGTRLPRLVPQRRTARVDDGAGRAAPEAISLDRGVLSPRNKMPTLLPLVAVVGEILTRHRLWRRRSPILETQAAWQLKATRWRYPVAAL